MADPFSDREIATLFPSAEDPALRKIAEEARPGVTLTRAIPPVATFTPANPVAISPVRTPITVPSGGPAPVLKYPGGKRRLLPWILPELSAHGAIRHHPGRYVEPFVGGGAVFFAIRAIGFGGEAVINDRAARVAAVYQAIRHAARETFAAFRALADADSREAYYEVRANPPDGSDPIALAAWTLYTNRAGFNGLYRENTRGEMNVPYGDGRPITAPDFETINRAALALRGTEIRCGDFAEITPRAGDLIYCDPPYLPITKTASFTTYAAGGFGGADQLRLAEWAAAARDVGARVVISNAGHVDSVAAFSAVADRVIPIPAAPRSISCKGDQRDAVPEYLFVLDARGG